MAVIDETEVQADDSDYRVLMKHKKKRTQRFILGLLYMIPIIMVATIALAWVFYPETYEFWQEFISSFGGTESFHDHLPNTVSMVIFIAGFATIGLITLIVSITYFATRRLRFWQAKGAYSLLLTIGCALICIPYDISTPFWIMHGIGAFLFMFGFAMFNLVAQVRRYFLGRRGELQRRPWNVIADFIMAIIVLLAMIMFLVFWFLQFTSIWVISPYMPQISQKIILIVDCLAVYFFRSK